MPLPLPVSAAAVTAAAAVVSAVPAAAAGCNALSEEERKLLAKRKVSAVITPLADAKAGLAPTSVLQTVKAGMNVALGTGGAVDSGNLAAANPKRHV